MVCDVAGQVVQHRIDRRHAVSGAQRALQFIHNVKQPLMLFIQGGDVHLIMSAHRKLPVAAISILSQQHIPHLRSAKIRQLWVVRYDELVAQLSTKKANLRILRTNHLSRHRWLIHGFSTRFGGFSRSYRKGDLNLGFTKDDDASIVQRNRGVFLHALLAGTMSGKAHGRQFKPWPLVTLRQIHSDIIHCVQSVPADPVTGDGLITATEGILLAIQNADCLPVILVDPKRHAVGVFHAGWRGTVKRIVEKGVGEMFRCFGSRPRDLQAAIGPGIQGGCYEVGEEVRTKFESQFSYAAKLFREIKESDPVREKYPLLFLTARAPGHGEFPPKIFLDLVEANRQQLLAAGLLSKNIVSSDLCTHCHAELLFSYRAEKGKTGRLMGVAGIRN